MSKKSRTNRNRRQFLAASTTAGLALLAGCGGGGGSGNNTSTGTATPAVTTHSGPADFRARLTGPSNVTLGQSFRLTLDARNVGGKTGTLSTTITVSEGRSTLRRTIERTIDSGERVKIRTDPIQFDVADSYTFSIGVSKISHTVTIQPKTAAFGKTFDLSDTLKGTVKSIDFHPTILYSPSKSDQTFLEQPSSNNLFAVTRVDLENVGSKPTAPDGEFELQNGEMRQTLGSSPLGAAKLDGKPLSVTRLSPGQQRSGWLLGELPRSKAKKAVTVVYQRDSSRTPPELKWTNTPKRGTRDLPQFTIKSFQLPKNAQQGRDVKANVTISNKANTTRTFRGLVQSRANDSGEWQSFSPITAPIPAGQSIQRNVTINGSSGGSVSYRLAPFNKTKPVEYVPPTVAFGESYTTTQNVKVTVEKPQTAKSVLLSGFSETERRTPPSGEKFVLARVQATAVGDSEGTPESTEFRLKTDSQTFTQAEKMNHPLAEPVTGTPYGGVYNPDMGESYSWYVVWTAPQHVSLSDLIVVWESAEDATGAYGETARWMKGGPSKTSQ